MKAEIGSHERRTTQYLSLSRTNQRNVLCYNIHVCGKNKVLTFLVFVYPNCILF